LVPCGYHPREKAHEHDQAEDQQPKEENGMSQLSKIAALMLSVTRGIDGALDYFNLFKTIRLVIWTFWKHRRTPVLPCLGAARMLECPADHKARSCGLAPQLHHGVLSLMQKRSVSTHFNLNPSTSSISIRLPKRALMTLRTW
jgi:hypothetical protein